MDAAVCVKDFPALYHLAWGDAAELTILDHVPDIRRFIVRIDHLKDGLVRRSEPGEAA